MIVVDASSIVGAAIKPDGVPYRAIEKIIHADHFALSAPVWAELGSVLVRPRLARFVDPTRTRALLDILEASATWFDPGERVTDCRDANDDKYLELALASDAHTIVSSDNDLLVLHPWRGVRILSPADYLAS